MPKKRLATWDSWSSWSSPVGLGIFFLTTALAAAIALYAVLNLLGTALELARPAPTAATYSPQDLQQLQSQGMMQGAPPASATQ